MDRLSPATPRIEDVCVEPTGAAWRWRLTTVAGASVAGLAPNRPTAERCAVFAALVAEALERTRRRRF